MIRRSIREWERINYGDGADEIPDRIASELAALAARSVFAGRGTEGVLEHGRHALRARGVVGIIASPECQLEILPKIEAAGEADTDDAMLRRRLVHMLAVAHDLRIDSGNAAQLGWQRDTLLEILIRIFCGKLIDAVRHGMPRQYVAEEDDLPTLRGRLDVTRQFSTLATQPQKLACRFNSLSPDIALNQVMKAVVAKLSRLAQANDNQRSLRELGFAYADIASVPAAALRWDRITLDRTNGRWRELVAWARLLLGDRFQQTSAGHVDGHALLFEMNALFEAYVARLARRALAGTQVTVSTQGGFANCLYQGERGRFRTRPDIILRHEGRPVVVLDTKWKRIAPCIDDPKQGVSQADVYQLMASSQLYDCDRVILLYPHHHGLSDDLIRDAFSVATPGSRNQLHVATMDIASGAAAGAIALAGLIRDLLTDGDLLVPFSRQMAMP